MVAAELEIFHSRRVAPTRRVALGAAHLPLEPRPGAGAILLGGIVAAHVRSLDDDARVELTALARQLERGLRVAQPQLRHRFQADRVGLTRTTHQLVVEDDVLRYALDDGDAAGAEQHLLGALYAAGGLPAQHRPAVFEVLHRAMTWTGGVNAVLIARLGGRVDGAAGAALDPSRWALGLLGLDLGLDPRGDRAAHRLVQRRYRVLLREAHPDHGGGTSEAADRIAELREARRILLG